ncbi:MAG: CotH kinase family protein, partial [Verrucomicrobia bacterium]|nr:CotH kinase family protein [Verrucomicrobiota bacterium]
MKTLNVLLRNVALPAAFVFTFVALSQTPPNQRPAEGGFPPGRGPGIDGPPSFGGSGGFGPGGMFQETKLVKQFDKDGDKRLNNEERKAAREYLSNERTNRGPGGPGGRRGGFGPRGETQEPAQPGQKLSPADVKSFPDAPAYDMKTLRTFFLEFENEDWEQELADFNNTDVEVPAKLTVDGKVYQDVGVHFRGASSLMMVPEGRKRSLNLSLDWVHEKQSLGGYRTFNLLNSHGDPTMLRTVLSHHISREYIPAPKANFVRVVINGEDWGVYASAQQFNKDFINDWYGTTKGARWKVPGSPQGRAGLEYLGDDPAPYKRLYEIKTKDNPEVWADLIKLCRVLNQTPLDRLEKALEPLLDVDGVLKFLALENVLVNNDGYWVRASDYSLYQDTKGRFHLFPHDANETFSAGGG